MATEQQQMKRNKNEKKLIMILLALTLVCVIAVIAVIYYFGFLGAFSILDVNYGSPKQLAVFVGIYLLLNIIGELFVKVFYYFLTKKHKARTLYECMISFSLNFLMNWIAISIVNGLYEPVRLTWYVEIVIAAFIALTDVTLDFEPIKKKRNRGE